MQPLIEKIISGLLTVLFLCASLQSISTAGSRISNGEALSWAVYHDQEHPQEPQGSVTWFKNCPNTTIEGVLKSISLTNCSSSACSLNVDEPLRLVMGFVAGNNHTNLSYTVVLSNDEFNILRVLTSGTGISNIEAGLEYSIGNNFIIDSDLPPSSGYELRIRRFDNKLEVVEICAVFNVSYVNNDDYLEPTTTTEAPANTTTTTQPPPPTTTTTPEPTEEPTEEPISTTTTDRNVTTTTTRPVYDCTIPGVFPDPHACDIYHVCQLYPNGTIWDTEMHCALGTVFCVKTEICEFEPDCPCSLSSLLSSFFY